VYYGQTVAWIKMKLGMPVAGWIKMPLIREVGLGPSDIVLDGDPPPLHKKGHIP